MVFLTPELDGAMFGFGVMCYSNSVRRLRMMRRTSMGTQWEEWRGKETESALPSFWQRAAGGRSGLRAAGQGALFVIFCGCYCKASCASRGWGEEGHLLLCPVGWGRAALRRRDVQRAPLVK